jgi:hypothetical protein
MVKVVKKINNDKYFDTEGVCCNNTCQQSTPQRYIKHDTAAERQREIKHDTVLSSYAKKIYIIIPPLHAKHEIEYVF